MSTQVNKKPTAKVPEEQTWFILSDQPVLEPNTDYYAYKTLQEAYNDEEYMDKSKPMYAFEAKCIGQLEFKLSIKK